jgi:hypothetical protein
VNDEAVDGVDDDEVVLESDNVKRGRPKRG